MFWTYPTALSAGRTVDPILAAYLVAAGAPMLVAALIYGLTALVTPPEAAGGEGESTPRTTAPPLCRRCGYDVRATPDGETFFERCPECGCVVERQESPVRDRKAEVGVP